MRSHRSLWIGVYAWSMAGLSFLLAPVLPTPLYLATIVALIMGLYVVMGRSARLEA